MQRKRIVTISFEKLPKCIAFYNFQSSASSVFSKAIWTFRQWIILSFGPFKWLFREQPNYRGFNETFPDWPRPSDNEWSTNDLI